MLRLDKVTAFEWRLNGFEHGIEKGNGKTGNSEPGTGTHATGALG